MAPLYDLRGMLDSRVMLLWFWGALVTRKGMLIRHYAPSARDTTGVHAR